MCTIRFLRSIKINQCEIIIKTISIDHWPGSRLCNHCSLNILTMQVQWNNGEKVSNLTLMSRRNVKFINHQLHLIDSRIYRLCRKFSWIHSFVNEKTNKYESAQLCTYPMDAAHLSFSPSLLGHCSLSVTAQDTFQCIASLVRMKPGVWVQS